MDRRGHQGVPALCTLSSEQDPALTLGLSPAPVGRPQTSASRSLRIQPRCVTLSWSQTPSEPLFPFPRTGNVTGFWGAIGKVGRESADQSSHLAHVPLILLCGQSGEGRCW